MSKLSIVHWPAAILKQKCESVPTPGPELDDFIQAMNELMEEHEGLGLAAPQVEKDLRLFIYRMPWQQELRVVLNPTIYAKGKDTSDRLEGCLSLPGITGKVKRPDQITVGYFDGEGLPVEISLEGLEARVFQHETDHLNGVMFFDRIGGLTRKLLLQKWGKLQRRREKAVLVTL